MAETADQSRSHPRCVMVTGPSGAGRSTAIRVLEDLGWEAIDNLPLSLLPRLLEGPGHTRPMALGIDTRNREFSVAALIEVIDRFAERYGQPLELFYLDCHDDVLLRRFSETRRRHPMAPAESPDQGIARELDLLVPIRARADILIDTSDLTPHELRAEVERWFAPEAGRGLAVSVNSFSYKRGLPRGIDMVFDCRFLRNPYWDETLRRLDGMDPRVQAYVAGDPRYQAFLAQVRGLAELLLPAYSEEGKAHLSIGFGCTGGQHRSVTLAEILARALAEAGWQVSIRHRELERRQPIKAVEVQTEVPAGDGRSEAAE
ncbi:MAG: RNase adapter RapZ [Paracoccaceae bacterium]